jgi:hypothetical protein
MLSRKRRRLIAGISVGVAASAFLVLTLVPVPQLFVMHGAALYDLEPTCAGIDTAQGTSVSFHWSAPSLIIFLVVSCSANQIAYQGNGTSGLGTFVSVGGVYEFGASCPEGPCVAADVYGIFTGPILPL